MSVWVRDQTVGEYSSISARLMFSRFEKGGPMGAAAIVCNLRFCGFKLIIPIAGQHEPRIAILARRNL